MAPAIPTRSSTASLEQILAPHVGITVAGGSYRCTCLHTYEPVITLPDTSAGLDPEKPTGIKTPDPEQRMIIDALHTQHQVERLLAAGVEPPKPADPREDIRRRAARR